MLALIAPLASRPGTTSRTIRPRSGRISEEREAIDHVVDLLGRIEDEWPSPGGEDLRSYLERLEKLQASLEDRLMRIHIRRAKLLGLDAPTKLDVSGTGQD